MFGCPAYRSLFTGVFVVLCSEFPCGLNVGLLDCLPTYVVAGGGFRYAVWCMFTVVLDCCMLLLYLVYLGLLMCLGLGFTGG